MIKGTKIRRMRIIRTRAPCPGCGASAARHSLGRRMLREIGVAGPTVLEIAYSKHYCESCRRHFTVNMEHIAGPKRRFTRRVERAALALFRDGGMTFELAERRMRERCHVHVPMSTMADWLAEDMDA